MVLECEGRGEGDGRVKQGSQLCMRVMFSVKPVPSRRKQDTVLVQAKGVESCATNNSVQ
jgi:hypothetical protein